MKTPHTVQISQREAYEGTRTLKKDTLCLRESEHWACSLPKEVTTGPVLEGKETSQVHLRETGDYPSRMKRVTRETPALPGTGTGYGWSGLGKGKRAEAKRGPGDMRPVPRKERATRRQGTLKNSEQERDRLTCVLGSSPEGGGRG